MSLTNLLWGESIPASTDTMKHHILTKYDDIREKVEANPHYASALERSVHDSLEYYKPYMGGMSHALHKAGKGLGVTAEAYGLATGDIVGTLGGEWLDLLAQIPDKAKGLWYGLSTGDLLGAGENVLRGILSYFPGLTVFDKGLTQIVQERSVEDAVQRFHKATDNYKPWHQRAYDKVRDSAVHLADGTKEAYKGVQNRAANIFTPDYEPAFA